MMRTMNRPDAQLHPFALLTPDFVLDAMESSGWLPDGRIFALNSYENRVYQIGIEEGEPLIAKFYRPGRWSREQILEEHAFVRELQEQELPVVAPLSAANGSTLQEWQGMTFALFPRKGGRAPELDNPDHLYSLGQALGRLHCVGKACPFQHRPTLSVATFGEESVRYVAEQMIPASLKLSYETLCRDLLRKIGQRFASVPSLERIRVHGDCHVGNILWRDETPCFIDFDDARMAPTIQDLWMLLSGSREEQRIQMSEIIEGYEVFHSFSLAELQLVESLRTLRMLHHAAWLARRWSDPAFPLNFPWFNTERYWGTHILELREQLFALDEPPLQLG
jgi:Ser/Thr protein kinase RdoA (MazF antagonist)